MSRLEHSANASASDKSVECVNLRQVTVRCVKLNASVIEETRVRTRLGDGHGLLFHGLQQRVVLAAHLVELVDAAAAWRTEINDSASKSNSIIATDSTGKTNINCLAKKNCQVFFKK
jgi:hypothetical protein